MGTKEGSCSRQCTVRKPLPLSVKEINVPRRAKPARTEEMLPKRRSSFASITKIKKRCPRPCGPGSCETFCPTNYAHTRSRPYKVSWRMRASHTFWSMCIVQLSTRTAQSMTVECDIFSKEKYSQDHRKICTMKMQFRTCNRNFFCCLRRVGTRRKTRLFLGTERFLHWKNC